MAAMVISSSPQPPPSDALLRHLRQDLGLSDNAIELGLKQCQLEQAPLPAVLWRFGLISVEQLDQLWSWQALQESPAEPA
ncbi:MAG: hypothetical protein RLZZ533_402 [Cyanobacteriota bacterium]|jgi:hypothetical protein